MQPAEITGTYNEHQNFAREYLGQIVIDFCNNKTMGLHIYPLHVVQIAANLKI